MVPAAGGSPTPLTTVDAARNEKSHRFPVFIPGGKAIIFLAQTAEGGARNDDSAIEALDLSSGKRHASDPGERLAAVVAGNPDPLLA